MNKRMLMFSEGVVIVLAILLGFNSRALGWDLRLDNFGGYLLEAGGNALGPFIVEHIEAERYKRAADKAQNLFEQDRKRYCFELERHVGIAEISRSVGSDARGDAQSVIEQVYDINKYNCKELVSIPEVDNCDHSYWTRVPVGVDPNNPPYPYRVSPPGGNPRPGYLWVNCEEKIHKR